jgi:hypothetical protein
VSVYISALFVFSFSFPYAGLLAITTSESEPERFFNIMKCMNPKQTNRRHLETIYHLFQVRDSVVHGEMKCMLPLASSP